MHPVVYSYKRSRTRELEVSIESLRNIKEWNGEVYVIGDKPLLEAGYKHLEITHTWGKGNKTNDEICAYLTAADFLDEFIIMADDQFILKPWILEYQNRGTLEEQALSRKGRDWYARQLLLTNQFLLDNGKPNLSYEMHIPFLVNSEQLKVAAEIVRMNKPVFIRSILGNWFTIPSKKSIDPKNQPITEETILYSSEDRTFNYEKIKEHLI